jgi:hypothetical protein
MLCVSKSIANTNGNNKSRSGMEGLALSLYRKMRLPTLKAKESLDKGTSYS